MRTERTDLAHCAEIEGVVVVIDVLRSFQFGASAPASDRGAFFYPPFSGPPTPNLLSTNDALLGLAPGVWPAVLTG